MNNDFSPEDLDHYTQLLERFPGEKAIKSPTEADVLCPVHGDNNPSLGVDLRRNGVGPKIVFSCRSHGCSQADIVAAAGLRPEDWNFSSTNGHKAKAIEGCTLKAYAAEKRLPLDFLEGDEVALAQTEYWGRPALSIPYPDEGGRCSFGEVLSRAFKRGYLAPKLGVLALQRLPASGPAP